MDSADQTTAPDSPARQANLRFIAMVPGWGGAPAASLSEADARADWALASSLWHPALLRHAAVLPSIVPSGIENQPQPHDRCVAARPLSGKTPPADANRFVIDTARPRLDVVADLISRFAPESDRTRSLDDPLALDFMALGSAAAWLQELTTAMGHADLVDHPALTREVLGAADAWNLVDDPGARNRLRAAFEILTQARERLYPVDNYLLDWMLLDPSIANESTRAALAAALDERVPLTVLASGRAIETLAALDPELIRRLLDAIDHELLDVAGGPYDDAPEALLPLESIVWQFDRGARAYQDAFDGRNVETFARRDFGLYPMLPQILRRCGIRFGYHVALDGGQFPVPRETKRLWEAPDGSSVEVLARPPLSASSEKAAREFPWRLARTLREDHVAALPFVRWPVAAESWFADLRRSGTYAPVFGRFVTVGAFFQRTDKPWDPLRSTPDDYQTPYLAKAVRERRADPISRLARHNRMRARLDAARTIHALNGLLGGAAPDQPDSLAEAESRLEQGTCDGADAVMDVHLDASAAELARRVIGPNSQSHPGFLVINPHSFPRRAVVALPDAALDLGSIKHLRASQFTDEGVLGVVDLPAAGFAWIPSQAAAERVETPKSVSVSGNTLSNELIEVEIDAKTGGIRSVRRPGEATPRLAQQLSVIGIKRPDGSLATIRMAASQVEIEYGGPALAQVVSLGSLIDESQPATPLARFRQRVRLWHGRPTAELLIELSALDADFARLSDQSDADPWGHAIVCRWAWADAGATLRRSSFLRLQPTKNPRPETSEIFEIASRAQKTALLFGGLAHHERQGPRMLDTLLVAGREASRSFEFGIVLDQEHPTRAAQDFIAPALLTPIAGPPARASNGWFLRLDIPSVVLTRLEWLHAPPDAVEPPFAFRIHLLETEGRAARGRVEFFLNPKSARLVDFQGEPIMNLDIEGPSILMDIAPSEIACLIVEFEKNKSG